MSVRQSDWSPTFDAEFAPRNLHERQSIPRNRHKTNIVNGCVGGIKRLYAIFTFSFYQTDLASRWENIFFSKSEIGDHSQVVF